jgi:hypothetical protein
MHVTGRAGRVEAHLQRAVAARRYAAMAPAGAAPPVRLGARLQEKTSGLFRESGAQSLGPASRVPPQKGWLEMMSLQDWRTCFPPASSAVRIGTLVRVVPELARATSKSPMFARRPLPLRASRARKPPFCLRADSQGSAFGEPGGKADLLDPTAQTFADLGDWDRHPTRMAAGVAGSKASPGRWRRARNCWETGSRNQPPEAATIHLTSALQVAGHNHLGFLH